MSVAVDIFHHEEHGDNVYYFSVGPVYLRRKRPARKKYTALIHLTKADRASFLEWSTYLSRLHAARDAHRAAGLIDPDFDYMVLKNTEYTRFHQLSMHLSTYPSTVWRWEYFTGITNKLIYQGTIRKVDEYGVLINEYDYSIKKPGNAKELIGVEAMKVCAQYIDTNNLLEKYAFLKLRTI